MKNLVYTLLMLSLLCLSAPLTANAQGTWGWADLWCMEGMGIAEGTTYNWGLDDYDPYIQLDVTGPTGYYYGSALDTWGFEAHVSFGFDAYEPGTYTLTATHALQLSTPDYFEMSQTQWKYSWYSDWWYSPYYYEAESYMPGWIDLGETWDDEEVVPPPPEIMSIYPDSAMVGATYVDIDVAIHTYGCNPSFNLPNGVTSPGWSWMENGNILLSVNISIDAPIGQQSISATACNRTSNSVSFTLDGPDHMLALSDDETVVNGAHKRTVRYRVITFTGGVAAGIAIGEDLTDTDWSCNQSAPTVSYTHCDESLHLNSNGEFEDVWTLSYPYTPSGCGYDSTTDHWRWCGPSAPSAGITFGTLDGFLHVDASRINGYTNPPNQMPQNFIIRP